MGALKQVVTFGTFTVLLLSNLFWRYKNGKMIVQNEEQRNSTVEVPSKIVRIVDCIRAPRCIFTVTKFEVNKICHDPPFDPMFSNNRLSHVFLSNTMACSDHLTVRCQIYMWANYWCLTVWLPWSCRVSCKMRLKLIFRRISLGQHVFCYKCLIFQMHAEKKNNGQVQKD